MQDTGEEAGFSPLRYGSSRLSCLVVESFCDRVSSLSLSLVKECRELVELVGTTFTVDIQSGKKVGNREWKTCIHASDKEQLLENF